MRVYFEEKVAVRKDTTDACHAFIGQNGNQGMNTILLFQLTAPAPFGCRTLQTGRPDFTNFQFCSLFLD
jgi:hypothetical protein